jgi:hypothetical protein
VAVSDHVVVFLPSGYVSHGKALHERTEASIVLWPQHKMPMIGHQAIGKNSHLPLFERFNNDSFEGKVVFVFVKQLLFTDASI